MNITDIKLVDKNIVITLDSADSVSAVYVDRLSNSDYKYSDTADEHTWAPTFQQSGNTITINTESFDPELDTSAFTVLVDDVLGFYYDEKELYNKEICLLTEFCSTCLDKQ